MLIWLIATAVTAIACAALFYAAGPRAVNAAGTEMDDANSHFRLVLAGIDADEAAGKLGAVEATAAKGELAREILRHKAEASKPRAAGLELGRGTLAAGLVGIIALSFGLYAALGKPSLPAQPLASRTDVAAQQIDLPAAIAKIEQALTENPDDLRGWRAIAPAYMELSRFADAARAYRRIIELDGETPDLQTGLAEAILLAGDGAPSPEAEELLKAASTGDPTDVMARLYLASYLTSQQRFDEAVPVWNGALALAKGDEPWLPAAQQGLAAAQNKGVAVPSADESEMIGNMVSGLADRLTTSGGTVVEWTQLVRAYLVLGDTAKAQDAYDRAVAAYPQSFDRGELDTLALGAGLTIKGAAP